MDDEERKNYGWLGWVVFIVGVIWINSLQSQISAYRDALDEANSNIEEANSSIEDAQGYAWSSYEEMGDALDGLSTVDTVSEP